MEAVSVVANLAAGIRKAHLDGKEYYVAPASLITPGVLAGSDGPLYYSPEETAKNYKQWEKIPLTAYHPFDKGMPVSAQHPGVLDRQGIGFVARPKINGNNKKLQSEAWFDIAKTKQVDNRIIDRLERGEPIELSTGLFVDKENALPGAAFNGRTYEFNAKNFRADHVAVLPDQIGACILPDQRVQGCIVKASKSWYSGEIVRITTTTGVTLTVTMNHPVLTEAGFLPAGQLTEGLNLLRYVGENKAVATKAAVVDENKKNTPTTAEDIFKTLAATFGVKYRRRASRLDFHGDAKFFQGDVQVVVVKSELRSDFAEQPAKSRHQGNLSQGSNGHPHLSRLSDVSPRSETLLSSDVGFVASSRDSFASHRTHLGVSQLGSLTSSAVDSILTYKTMDNGGICSNKGSNLCTSHTSSIKSNDSSNELRPKVLAVNSALTNFCVFGPGAELNVSLTKFLTDGVWVSPRRPHNISDSLTGQIHTNPAIDNGFRGSFRTSSPSVTLTNRNTASYQQLPNRRAAEAKLFRQLVKRFPGKITTDKITRIEVLQHDGPVYDFESTTGYILAENLIVSNCSISDGCGVLVNSASGTPTPLTNKHGDKGGCES